MGELVDRRRFLVRAVKWIVGAVAAVIGFPAVAYVVGPSIKEGSRLEVVALGSARSVEIGTPTLFKTAVERTAGYLTVQEDLNVYVKTEDGRDFIGLSNICTHLGAGCAGLKTVDSSTARATLVSSTRMAMSCPDRRPVPSIAMRSPWK